MRVERVTGSTDWTFSSGFLRDFSTGLGSSSTCFFRVDLVTGSTGFGSSTAFLRELRVRGSRDDTAGVSSSFSGSFRLADFVPETACAGFLSSFDGGNIGVVSSTTGFLILRTRGPGSGAGTAWVESVFCRFDRDEDSGSSSISVLRELDTWRDARSSSEKPISVSSNGTTDLLGETGLTGESTSMRLVGSPRWRVAGDGLDDLGDAMNVSSGSNWSSCTDCSITLRCSIFGESELSRL